MRIPCFFILLCLLHRAHAQEMKKHPRREKIALGFNFSPDYTNRTLKNNNGGASADMVINSRENTEIGKFGYTTGITISTQSGGHFSFESGLQFSNKGYRTKELEITSPFPDPNLPEKSAFKHNYYYIDIPFRVNFMAGKEKIKFIGATGIAVNFLVSSKDKITLIYRDGRTETRRGPAEPDYRNFNISPFISLGIQSQISTNAFIRIEPTFRYGLLKNMDTPVTEYIWNAGLNIGCYYRLK